MNTYDSLNKEQQEAVFYTEGPLLILAGAGSGKTRVLTYRIACLISEKKVRPWNILAVTFTNKAAREMRERVDNLVEEGASDVWVATFHSTCVKILRRYIDRLGYDRSFTIYDADDQKSLVKTIFKQLGLDPKKYSDKSIMSEISRAKDELRTPEDLEAEAGADAGALATAAVYREYQTQLRRNNALDFDDLIMKTVELFRKCPDVLERYQNRFRYLMVDEYQDTNTAQFHLVSLLAQKYQNLCVVGDDDQSIYSFRGANIDNILGFEDVFPNAKVIRLEQNYRSTQNILDAANGVIANNESRKPKRLWTENGKGDLIRFRRFLSADEEADFVIDDIDRARKQGSCRYGDCVVLYRTNAQSRLFEEKCLMDNIPYKVVGGVNFYGRMEIKDLISYLKTVDNARDDLAVRRIINVPKRGIGTATIARIQNFAEEHDISFYDALLQADEIPSIGRGRKNIVQFVEFIQMLRSKAEVIGVRELLEEIIEDTGYVKDLEAEGTDEARSRIENIDELISKAESYEEGANAMGEVPSLSGFLEEVALVADIDSVSEDQDYILLMTLHSAKGLEFPRVYMAGMDDGIFPGGLSIYSENPADMEEERRLCYVGITRAKEQLTFTSATSRMIRGEWKTYLPSRFLDEIPEELLDMGKKRPQPKVSRQTERKREIPKTTPVSPPPKAASLDYDVGDTVLHEKFGEGVVTKIADGGRDFEVTVEFERWGVKKFFAGFAGLKKVQS